MSTSIQEVLMALGQWKLDLVWDPELAAELEDYTHLQFYQGYDLLYTGVLLNSTKKRSGISISGRNLGWWLGQQNDGPVVEFAEYLSGRNKLGNPGFELEDLYWRSSESTVWSVLGSQVHAGAFAAHVTTSPLKDDILQSDEVFTAVLGNEFEVKAWVKRVSGTVGRLRLRATFEGRFALENILVNNDLELGALNWTDQSDISGDTSVVNSPANAYDGDWVMKIGPTTQKELLLNGSFETGDLSYWENDPGWDIQGGFSGAWGVSIEDPPSQPYHLQLSYADTGLGYPAPVKAKERYLARGFVLCGPDQIEYVNDADGNPQPITVPSNGEAYMTILQTNANDPLERAYAETPFATRESAQGAWQLITYDFEIQDGYTLLVPMLSIRSTTSGRWYYDEWSVKRIEGNTCRIRSDQFSLTPEKSYTLTAQVRSDDDQVFGELRARVIFSATGRTDVIQDSSTIKNTEGSWLFFKFDFTPPSGYDLARIEWIGLDILGGPMWVDAMQVTLSQDNSRSYDVKSAATQPTYTELTQTIIVPEGSEKVRVELVAEADADGWVVDDVSLIRTDAAPTVSSDLVKSLLFHPQTTLRIMGEGSIVGVDTVVFDYVAQNITNRDLITKISQNGLVDPIREWRINPDNTLDWDEPENLFEVRDLVLLEHELILLSDLELERTVEDKLTDLKVIGAERNTLSGQHITVVGVASRSPGDSVDWYGNPLSRVRIAEESTLNYDEFADAYAGEQLVANQAQEQMVEVQLADWRAVGQFNVGDWIGLYQPETGLADYNNERHYKGRVIWPWVNRVLSRTWEFGGGAFRVELRRLDGTTKDISQYVLWSDATTASIEVGSVQRDFTIDPQGGAAGTQFLRFRASR